MLVCASVRLWLRQRFGSNLGVLPFIDFFGRGVSSYALLGLLGSFAAIIVAGFRCQKYGLSRQEPVYIGLFAGTGLLLGGVLMFSFTQIPNAWQAREFFLQYPVLFLSRLFGGMVFYGGLFGALIGVYVYSRFFKSSFDVAMKLAVPVFPLAHFFMRLGCFAAGCCYGLPHPMGIAFTQSLGAPNNVPLIPVQLFEALANLLIFVALWIYTKKERHWQTVLALYAFLYALVRFSLEFLRGDEARGIIFGLPTSQFISAVVLLACLAYFMKFKRVLSA